LDATQIPDETPDLDDAPEADPVPAQTAPPARDRTLLICLVGVIAALILGPGTWWVVKARQIARSEAWANEAVAEKVEAARAELALDHSNEAMVLLQEALATTNATDLEEARDLLASLQQTQADAHLQAAESALRQKEASRALRLLDAYLANPHGSQQKRAEMLRDELVLATSGQEAERRLGLLDDTVLAEFARTGQLKDIGTITDSNVRVLYLDNLHDHLAAEQQRRTEVLTRRQARIGATPVFRELLEFVDQTRQRLRPKPNDDSRLIALLLDELGVQNSVERKAITAQLRPSQPVPDGIAASISSKRASLKERFRAYRDFDKVDWQMFDRAVDWHLDQLQAELVN
jgi:hypothetical protein